MPEPTVGARAGGTPPGPRIEIGGLKMHEQATPVEPAASAEHRLIKRPVFLTVSESAAMLRVDDVTVTRAIRSGEFPAIKIRRRYVVPAAAIDRIVKDVIESGRCIDIADWTSAWAAETGTQLPTWAR